MTTSHTHTLLSFVANTHDFSPTLTVTSTLTVVFSPVPDQSAQIYLYYIINAHYLSLMW